MLQSTVAQETYTSPYTQHFPSEIVEPLERVITINERTISIETEIDDSTTDVLVLYITSFKLNEKDPENFRVYNCSSRDGKFHYQVMVPKKPEYILVVQPSSLLPGELKEFRLLLD